ncbi:growth arrest-specific protein 1 [Platysternon megacephalum]|uniref:Growth arrest-specific protein 1 n=1 Tax=Platysternon megacephalum TaxID=55544 RepID=A0A4D9F5B5_9SAUR|nr:growth arrest-specific protein 1 [Platysternon megacephalum]
MGCNILLTAEFMSHRTSADWGIPRRHGLLVSANISPVLATLHLVHITGALSMNNLNEGGTVHESMAHLNMCSKQQCFAGNIHMRSLPVSMWKCIRSKFGR